MSATTKPLKSKPQRFQHPVSKDIDKLILSLKEGKSLQQSMLDAGYAASSAHAGKRALPKSVLTLIAKAGGRFEALGLAYSPAQRANIARGALVDNVLTGKDKATKSIELLGRDIEVGMFRSDGNSVAVQINLPPGMERLLSD